MLGAIADRLPFPAEVLRDAVLERFVRRKPQFVDMNREAFELGRRAVAVAAEAV
jgi:indolepyruvate ferredoxin oxidoreductase beta subunit